MENGVIGLLIQAIEQGQADVLIEALQADSSLVNLRDQVRPDSLLARRAAPSVHNLWVQKRLTPRAGRDLLSQRGDTLLHFCAFSACTLCPTLLINAGSKVNAFNLRGLAPLYYAAGQGAWRRYILHPARCTRLVKQANTNAMLTLRQATWVYVRYCSPAAHEWTRTARCAESSASMAVRLIWAGILICAPLNVAF